MLMKIGRFWSHPESSLDEILIWEKKWEPLSFQLISLIVKSGRFHTKNVTESWLRRRAKEEMHRVIRLNSLHYSLWKTIIRPQVVNIAEFPQIRLRENHWNSWEVAMDSSWPIICLARAAAERYISCTATLWCEGLLVFPLPEEEGEGRGQKPW